MGVLGQVKLRGETLTAIEVGGETGTQTEILVLLPLVKGQGLCGLMAASFRTFNRQRVSLPYR